MSEPHSPQPEPIRPSAFEPLDLAAPPPPGRRHPVRWLLAGVALLFLLVMVFLLRARSLEIQVATVSTPDIAIDGFALPFGERYLLLPGDYRVRVSAAGYRPLETDVTVTDEESQTLRLEPGMLPGRVSVTSLPPAAAVSVDGQGVGTTPLVDLPLEAGEHRLAVQAERYRPAEQVITVTGRDLQQQWEVELVPAWAAVAIDSVPGGAQLLVDGEEAGTTPATVEILEGERHLMLRLAGYADWEQSLEVEAGRDQQLGTVALQPAAGVLQLNSVPSGASVTLDGEFQGQTPLSLELAPGSSHRLAVFKPGYRRHSESVQLGAGASDSRTVNLQAQLGEVRFDISPPEALLKVDGKVLGRGSRTLSLPAFEHSVEVSLEGYATIRRRVTPRPGLQQLVQARLQGEQEARMARLKPELTTSLGQTLLLLNPAESPLADFTMGSSRREPGRRANEVLHPVALRRMFYLQTTEVTNAQFRQYRPDHNSGQVEGSSLNRDQQPVVQVSWQEAASFCNWLSAREGLPAFYRESNGIVTGFNPDATGYRLPTEAEWAWAARAGGSTLLTFPWGDAFPPKQVVENYADTSSAYVTGRVLTGYDDGQVVTAPVASFPPNRNRLYDMGGNVAEWLNDVYTIPSANGATQTDPLGAQSGDNYVIRGASWTRSKIGELRLSARDYGQAGRDDVGFRLARYAE